ncbi:MAG: DUF2514 family protein [Chitinophagaceae bacterium]|nr:MAG: DUF2514 family protein [Chitinophagaceae bacterium]
MSFGSDSGGRLKRRRFKHVEYRPFNSSTKPVRFARAHAHDEYQDAEAGAAGQRLRNEAAKLAATVSCPATDNTTIARGQAATRAMVFSDLLARADARAGELAQAYDRAKIAGLQCEQEYGAL